MDTVINSSQLAPDFTLPDLGGEQHTLAGYRGKVVVLNFWSAECPWSQRADQRILPMLETWGEDVVLLSIASNANETREQMAQAARQRGISLVLHDSEQVVARTYGAVTTPQVFVIDPQGILRYQGAFDDASFRQPDPTKNYLHWAVEKVLAGERPEPAAIPSYGCTVIYHKL